MSVKEDEDKYISEETQQQQQQQQQQETCPVKTLAAVSLSVSVIALVISSVFATFMILSYFSPERNDDNMMIPDLCRLPPDPGPCTSSVNRRVISGGVSEEIGGAKLLIPITKSRHSDET